MIATYTQVNRPMAVSTPLGPDALVLVGLSGQEGISQLFHFHLDVVGENKQEIPFDKLLGQPITARLQLPGDSQPRFFNGICSQFSQGESDEAFSTYRIEVVPKFWLWTKVARSRLFQHKNVPDILKEVLQGLDVTFELKGTYYPRDYCVQYRETDFNFASRLMEEEGIYYYFKHTAGGHKMVVANTPVSHVPVPGNAKIVFKALTQGAAHSQDVIFDWSKTQSVPSGKFTLWDHTFELPHKHLDAERPITESVQIGKTTHKLKFGPNGKLEVYDWPGEYAQRFDGIDKGGGDRPADLQKIFEDNARTVTIRMQQEAAASVEIHGASNCRQLTSGHKFTLTTLAGDKPAQALKPDGDYVLTTVTHAAHVGNYRSGNDNHVEYHNSFTCIPASLPFRPARHTPKPIIPGPQSAVVVGPPGEEIFTDKYGRIKVQFHWDRQGQYNADSSCWVRVGTPWAGQQWGMIHIPRIRQEVLVAFEEGDPDRPVVVGSVYNAEMMPPYALPANKTQSGIKSRSSLKGSSEDFNEICFEDKKGQELLYIRAQKDQTIAVENDEAHWVGHDRQKTVDHDETTLVQHDRTETVGHDEKITIGNDRTEQVVQNETITIGVNRTEQVGANESITVAQNRSRFVGQNESITVGLMRTHTVGVNEAITVGGAQEVSVGAMRMVSVGASQLVNIGSNLSEKVGKNMSVDAGEQILLKTGDASILMKKDGTIVIEGKDILIKGSGKITAKASSDMILKGSKIGQN